MAQQVLTITQLNEYIRSRMDVDPLLRVRILQKTSVISSGIL